MIYIAHSDPDIRLIPGHHLSPLFQISLMRCIDVCLKSMVIYCSALDKGFLGNETPHSSSVIVESV